MLVDAETGSELIEAKAPRSQVGVMAQVRAWGATGLYGWLALSVWIIVVLAVNIPVLVHTPATFVDEAWNANRSWALMHTGRAFGTLDAGVFDRYDGYWTYFPWLAAAAHVPFIA